MVHVTKTETILKKIQKCSPNCLLSNSVWCLCDRLELELSPTSQLFPIPCHVSPRAYPASILSLPSSSSPCAPQLCLWTQRTPWCHAPSRAWDTTVLRVGPDVPLSVWQNTPEVMGLWWPCCHWPLPGRQVEGVASSRNTVCDTGSIFPMSYYQVKGL